MNTLTGWAGSGSGIVIIGCAWALMHHQHKHSDKIHDRIHPILYRLIIFGMHAGGSVLALSALGGWFATIAGWFIGVGGTGLVHGIIVVAGAFLALTVILGFLFDPNPKIAWCAVIMPFVLTLAGGKLHSILTVMPGPLIAASFMHWIGG